MPASFGAVSRLVPVSTFSTVMLVAGTDAPVASVTLPGISDVVLCPKTAVPPRMIPSSRNGAFLIVISQNAACYHRRSHETGRTTEYVQRYGAFRDRLVTNFRAICHKDS